MSISILNGLELNKTSITGMVIDPRASAPASPATGQIYFDTALCALLVWDGVDWEVCSFGPRTALRQYNDFITDERPFFATSASGGGSGNAATCNSNSNADFGGSPGLFVMNTGTGTAGRGSIGWPTNNGLNAIAFSYGVWWNEFRLRLDNLSDATDTFTIYAGWNDTVSGDATDGVYFRYTNGVNSGKFEAVCRNNSSETAVDTGITVAATTFYRMRIEVNAAGTSVVFKIDGNAVATITTNIPTGTSRVTAPLISILKSAGTTARVMRLDYWDLINFLTTAR